MRLKVLRHQVAGWLVWGSQSLTAGSLAADVILEHCVVYDEDAGIRTRVLAGSEVEATPH